MLEEKRNLVHWTVTTALRLNASLFDTTHSCCLPSIYKERRAYVIMFVRPSVRLWVCSP